MFPFSVKYAKPFNKIISAQEIGSVLRYIKEYIETKDGENVIIDENRFFYKSPLPIRGRKNYFGLTDGGKFEILNNGHESILTYRIFMYQYILSVFILVVIVGLMSSSVWSVILGNIWFVGLGLLIVTKMHNRMFEEIMKGLKTPLDYLGSPTNSSP